MKHAITNEATEQIDLDVQDERFSLIERTKKEDGWKVKVVILNKREALKLHQAISEEILGLNKRT